MLHTGTPLAAPAAWPVQPHHQLCSSRPQRQRQRHHVSRRPAPHANTNMTTCIRHCEQRQQQQQQHRRSRLCVVHSHNSADGGNASAAAAEQHHRQQQTSLQHLQEHLFAEHQLVVQGGGGGEDDGDAAGHNNPLFPQHIERFGFRSGFDYEFDRGPMIGSGSFGVVHVARHLRSGQKYAVKSIPKQFGEGYYLDPAFVARVFHEVDIARHMGQSLNVIHLVEAYEDDVNVDLVLELASGGSLWERIQQQRGGGVMTTQDEEEAARVIADVLRAVAQCHAKGVILRDVKPDNFLFTSRRGGAPLKMVDFGLAQLVRPGQTFTERAGTPYFVAPEVLKQSYSFPADVWSAGVTAYQLLAGRLPWANDTQWVDELAGNGSTATMLNGGLGASSVANLAAGNGGPNIPSRVLWRAILSAELDFTWPPWDTISAGAVDLIQAMLTRDPQQRPTAAQLLQHPWLASAATCRTCWSTSSSSSSSMSSSGSGSGLKKTSDCKSCAGGVHSSSSNNTSSNQQQQQQQREQQAVPQPPPQQQQPVEQQPLYLQPLEDSLVQRLQRYGTFPRLKQVALRRMVTYMLPHPPPCLAVYAAAFEGLQEVWGGQGGGGGGQTASGSAVGAGAGAHNGAADADAGNGAAASSSSGGRLPAARLVELLSSDVWDLSDVEVRMLVSQFDLDHDGCVDLAEWLAALIDWPLAQQHPMWATWLQQVFTEFDTDHDGRVSADELLAALGGSLQANWSELDQPFDSQQQPLLSVPPSSSGAGADGTGGAGYYYYGNNTSSSSYHLSSSNMNINMTMTTPSDKIMMMPEPIRCLLRHVDVDGAGQLSYAQFAQLVETGANDQLGLFPSRRCADRQQAAGGLSVASFATLLSSSSPQQPQQQQQQQPQQVAGVYSAIAPAAGLGGVAPVVVVTTTTTASS